MSISTLGAEFPIIQATGGTITEITVGQLRYRVHTFTSTGVLDMVVLGNTSAFSRPLIEYVVVAGGGAGGGLYSGLESIGGGGAGGYLSSVVGEMSGGGLPALSPLPAITQTLTVTIGAGGASTTLFPAQVQGGDGSNSSLGPNIVAIGGGGGGSINNVDYGLRNGRTGGSGGGWSGRPLDQFSWDNFTFPAGGRDTPYTRNTGTYSQGYAGGRSGYAGGGGGGAGGVGGSVLRDDFSVAGAGGVGVSSVINGTATFRAGGGGGGMYGTTGALAGAGGLGGGGAGGQWVSPFTTTSGTAGVAGTANTGGGGGGNAGYSSTSVSAAGGSGVVIVRYPIGLA